MSTEYRTGVPSRAHIAAAERLGLLWRAQHNADYYWRFDTAGRSVYDDRLHLAQSARLSPIDDDERIYYYRPIRPDGTPVDWETLDAEVSRVAGAAAQPQGFRADLWRRICEHSLSEDHTTVSLADIDRVEDGDFFWKDRSRRPWRLRSTHSADILTRWTVYQELKPLYDLVDGAVGEVAMPRDVIRAWWDRAPPTDCGNDHCPWSLHRESTGLVAQGPYRIHAGNARGAPLSNTLMRNNFAAVLDAVAEARVRERTQQSAQPANVAPSTQPAPARPEPRRFADVRPDRHGWRWWLVRHALPLHQTWLRIDHNRPYDWSTVETVIPTDEQGNPVSWGSIGPADQGRTDPVRAIVGSPPTSAELPRFTADELDDVDHSRTTKLDQATLRRGKLPTVEQIAKYREVRAKRTGGTVADALKESRIDCEVAQYVLERWVGGLGDVEAKILVEKVWRMLIFETKAIDTFVEVENAITQTTLDATEAPDAAAQQVRRQAEERRQRLAQVQAQIAVERAATQSQEVSEPHRFDLIEPDPHADPTASIRAWEARQAAAKREKAKVAAMPAKPAAVPRRPAIEVVNAEEGLSRGDVVLALLGRAMHGGC